MRTCVAITLFSMLFVSSAVGQQTETVNFAKFNPAQSAEYEKQLNAILKTRRDEEKKFVRELVVKVRDGAIPARLVSTSFQWVRNKRPTTRYPFVYFERVLRLQAKQLRIQQHVPPFDYRIYSNTLSRN